MAVGTGRAKADDAPKPVDTRPAGPTRSGSAPVVRPVMVDTAEAHTDRVAMVSRNKDGNPDQSTDYEVLVPDDASDEDRRRAENRPADNRASTGEGA